MGMLHLSLVLTSLILTTGKPVEKREITPPAHDICSIQNSSWGGGEEITYKLYYQLNLLWLPAGEATFKVKDLGDRYHIVVTGKTISAFEWFYKVEDLYESYIDKETLLPISFHRDIKEGKYVWWDKFTFDHDTRVVHGVKGWPDKPTKYYTANVTDCMHDLISIIYHVRNIDFDRYNAGQLFDVKVFVEEEYPLQVEVKDKNVVQKVRNMGKYLTHRIRPQVVSGHFFNDDTRMDVYVSADGNRIPLLIESPVSVGNVKAVLTSYKGLKYPLKPAN
jgi:hypothetical protein